MYVYMHMCMRNLCTYSPPNKADECMYEYTYVYGDM